MLALGLFELCRLNHVADALYAEAPRSLMRIVVEAAQNLDRANFPLKSKAKKFDGLTVGFRPSAENFCV